MFNLETLITNIIHCSYESNHIQCIYSIKTIKRHFVNDNMLDAENCQNISQAFQKKRLDYFSRALHREKKKIFADLSTYDKLLSYNTNTFQNQIIIDLVREIIGFDEIRTDTKLYACELCEQQR